MPAFFKVGLQMRNVHYITSQLKVLCKGPILKLREISLSDLTVSKKCDILKPLSVSNTFICVSQEKSGSW